MRKPILLGAVIAMAIVISAGVLAAYAAWKSPAYAEVVSVEPVKQAVSLPEKVCRDKEVARRQPVKDAIQDAERNADTVSSGTVRDRVAQTVGTGTGGTVVTGKGAVAASNDKALRQKGQEKVPHKVAENSTEKTTMTERHCSTALRHSETVVGYDVRYRLHGKTSKVRMDHDPGKRIPVRNGQVVLTGDSLEGSGFRG
jgi:uncharacterized protein YcfJ